MRLEYALCREKKKGTRERDEEREGERDEKLERETNRKRERFIQ